MIGVYRRRKSVLFIAIFTLLVFDPAIAFPGQYQVSRVIDGDTIEVKKGTTKLTVRLVGIDAPEVSHAKNEPGQPHSQTSTKHLASLVLNQTIAIESYGFDRNGRMLGEVFLEDRNINLEMVKAGYAEVYRGKPSPGLDLQQYWEAERDAKNAGRGIWVLGDKYVSPREWRRMRAD